MDDIAPVLIKVAQAAKLSNISVTQAYRLVPKWRELGIIVDVGPHSIRLNRRRFLEWAKEAN